MARLKNANRALKYDKRLTRHNLSAGYLTQEEHDQLINELPDLADQCEKIVMEAESDSLSPLMNSAAESHSTADTTDSGSSSPFGSNY